MVDGWIVEMDIGERQLDIEHKIKNPGDMRPSRGATFFPVRSMLRLTLALVLLLLLPTRRSVPPMIPDLLRVLPQRPWKKMSCLASPRLNSCLAACRCNLNSTNSSFPPLPSSFLHQPTLRPRSLLAPLPLLPALSACAFPAPTAAMAPRLNIPPVTRILLIAIIASSFLYNVARWKSTSALPDRILPQDEARVPYLILVPAKCLFYPWTFILTTFVEQNVLTLVVNLATVFFGGRYLERAWGSKGFAIAFLVAAIIPNLVAAPTYIIWGAIMRNPRRALTPISGGITIQAAFLVAFKQLVPEHTVSILRGFIKMRVKHFPAVFLLANTISGLLLGTDTAAIFAWVGLVTFWIYLRFYKRQPDLSGTSTSEQGMKGDASETFAFATFFPDKIQPPIAAVCDQIFILLCNMKLCVPFSEEAIASGNEQVAARGEGGLPSLLSQGRGARGMGKREEAERRRALALKALDQRLVASSSRSATTAPAVVPAIQPGQESSGQTEQRPEEAR